MTVRSLNRHTSIVSPAVEFRIRYRHSVDLMASAKIKRIATFDEKWFRAFQVKVGWKLLNLEGICYWLMVYMRTGLINDDVVTTRGLLRVRQWPEVFGIRSDGFDYRNFVTVFPGPPNYESIKRGDRKETAIILTLVARACTTGNDPQGFDVPETGLREMQLVVMKHAHWKTVRHRMGKRAIVTGTIFHAHTGRPLLCNRSAWRFNVSTRRNHVSGNFVAGISG
jgi:hypothetical protein